MSTRNDISEILFQPLAPSLHAHLSAFQVRLRYFDIWGAGIDTKLSLEDFLDLILQMIFLFLKCYCY